MAAASAASIASSDSFRYQANPFQSTRTSGPSGHLRLAPDASAFAPDYPIGQQRRSFADDSQAPSHQLMSASVALANDDLSATSGTQAETGGGADDGAAPVEADNVSVLELQQNNPEAEAPLAGETDQPQAQSSHEIPERHRNRDILLSHHKSRIQAMHDMFERRQLGVGGNSGPAPGRAAGAASSQPLQSSQELSPISIGLDPVANGVGGFGMNPFDAAMGGSPHEGPMMPKAAQGMANADNLDGPLGPALPFGLNPLPHLLGFQNQPAFDGPQRGDQSTHSNHLAAAPVADSEVGGPSQKVYPKIFRFTDGRINLSEFEKQKKIRLSKNQNGDNHIESSALVIDGRPLKRKSFLILHGGLFRS